MIKANGLQYFTCAEAATILGFSPDHVRRLILEGKIKAIKIGHNWLMTKRNMKKVKRQRFPRDNKD